MSRELSKLEEAARDAEDAPQQARTPLPEAVAAQYTAAPQAPAPGAVALPGAGPRRFAKFDPQRWTVALVPAPPRDCESEVA